MRPSHRLHSATLSRRALLAGIYFCLWTLLLLTGGFASTAQAQVIDTVAGGFNPSAAASDNFCVPLRALANHGTDVYLMSCNRIIRVDSAGHQTVVAGNGITGFSGDGGPATSASLGRSHSISLDAAGDLFILDFGNNRVREVPASGPNAGKIITIAGTGVAGYSGDGGPATAAEIAASSGSIFADPAGDVFIADEGNLRVREVIAATGVITTVAGDGTPCKPAGTGVCGDGGLATSASLRRPRGVFVNAGGDIFIADTADHRIRMVAAGTGIISTVAGNGTFGFNGDNIAATSAELFGPESVFGDASGNLFIADLNNNRIREFTVGGNIQTVAGNGAAPPASCTTSLDQCIGDGGPATSAIVVGPEVVSLDGSGDIFIETGGFGIQEVVAGTGKMETFAFNGALGGGGDGGLATSAQFEILNDAVEDKAGNIFIADGGAGGTGSIREVLAATGDIQTVAGGGVLGTCTVRTEACIGNGGLALGAVMNPQALALDGSGNIFIADGLGEIREFTVGGNIQDVAGSYALAGGDSGDGGPATSAALSFPTGVALDSAGNIFIADNGNSNIREVIKVTGNIQTIAGDPAGINFGYSGDGGPATVALLNSPVGVWVDASDDVFITDALNARIREIMGPRGATGIIETVAGNGIPGFSGDGGLATSAEINNPQGLHGDKFGTILFADFGSNTVRAFNVGGFIQTVAGNQVMGFSGDGGLPLSAELNNPLDVALGGHGQLLITDFTNARVRRVTLKPTTTTLASSPNPALLAQTITFTMTVKSTTTGTPTGFVTLFVSGPSITGTVPFATVPLNASGVATYKTTAPTPGTFTVTAAYLGSPTFAPSTSNAVSQVINGNSTTTSLTSSPNPSAVGQSVTFTATVTSPTPGTLTGSVTFTKNGNPLGTVTLTSGVASITTLFGHAGSHVIVATYSGDSTFAPSTSAPLTQTVHPGSTTTALISSLNPSLVGQAVTFTARVTGISIAGVARTSASTSGTPTGIVTFTNNGNPMGSATLNASGVATLTVAFGHMGSHAIIATYAGDADFATSTSAALPQVVNPIPTTTTTLTSSLNPSQVEQSVTFTATVTSTTSGTPAGSVTFTNNGNPMGSATLAGGVATITVAFVHAGSHSIIATYAGTAVLIGSSATLPQIVKPAVTTTTLISSLSPSLVGHAVTFTATVTSGAGKPTGTVSFTNNGVLMGTATLTGGTATFTRVFGAVGPHAIIAQYSGDANFAASASVPLTQTVNPLPATTTTLVSSLNPSLVGHAVTFTATVSSGAGTPTGTVSFTNNGVLMGTATLISGAANFTRVFGAVGAHTIVAQYGGAATFAASASVPLTQNVKLVPTTTALSSSLNPSLVGQAVKFTATVTSTTSGTPAGSVTFTNNGVLMGSATLNASGVATFPRVFGAVGAHVIVAQYSGDTNFAGSTSAPLTENVNPFTVAANLPLNVLPVNDPPALATDGNNFFAATETATGLVGMLFDAGGAPIKSVSLSAGAGSVFPLAAFDGTNYWVIYLPYSNGTSGSVNSSYARRISPKGALVDATGINLVTVGPPYSGISATGFAFGSTNGLLAFSEFNSITSQHELHGVLVSNGTVVAPDFAIAIDNSTHLSPAVAFDGANFFVTWRNLASSGATVGSIYGVRVSAAGSVIDPAPIAISTAPNGQDSPSVAFDGTNYLVAWLDLRTSGNYLVPDIYGARVTTTGVLLDGSSASGGFPINSGGRQERSSPRVVFTGLEYLVTWTDLRYANSGSLGVQAARVSTDGTLPGGPNMAIMVSGPPSAATVSQFTHSVAAAGSHSAAVIWFDNQITAKILDGASFSTI
jgi:large repetitive protein